VSSVRWLQRQGFLSALVILSLAAGCDLAPLTPEGAPYLAVVVLVDAPNEVTVRGPYRFRVRELSGTIKRDTTFFATPRDTTILSVKPATYVVEIADVPAACGIRQGGVQYVVVPENSNTSLARFLITCRNALTISVLTDGNMMDTSYAYTVVGDNGSTWAGTLAPSDTVLLDGVRDGHYVVSLRHVAENCTVISDGGDNVSAEILKSGGASVTFRVSCAEPARRPRLVSIRGSYDRGAIGLILRIVDPDKDVERVVWDITDCHRRSVLPGGVRRRGGFSGWQNVTNRDTAVVISGWDVSLTDEQLEGRCHAVYAGDERGNVSEVVEVPLVRRNAARSPGASRFNAQFVGTVALRVSVDVFDPDNDFAGAFLYYSLRDGIVLLPPDGIPDRVILQPAGVIGATFPELPFNIGYGAWSDYLGVILYLVDAQGNVTRLEDTDLFQ
jgi:hypothetical protein